MSRINLTASLPRVTTITMSGLDARIFVTSTIDPARGGRRRCDRSLEMASQHAGTAHPRPPLRLAECVIGVEKNCRFGVELGDLKQALDEPKATSHQHSGMREIAGDVFESLFGDLRRRADIDNERHPVLLADLSDGNRATGIDVADDAVGALVDDALAAILAASTLLSVSI